MRQGHGRSGNNRDYVLETVKSLEALNIIDHDLQVLAERLKGSQDAQRRAGDRVRKFPQSYGVPIR